MNHYTFIKEHPLFPSGNTATDYLDGQVNWLDPSTWWLDAPVGRDVDGKGLVSYRSGENLVIHGKPYSTQIPASDFGSYPFSPSQNHLVISNYFNSEVDPELLRVDGQTVENKLLPSHKGWWAVNDNRLYTYQEK